MTSTIAFLRASSADAKVSTKLSAVCLRSVCGLFAAENCGDRRTTLRVPQGVGLNHRGRAVLNQWSWAVERFANMFANQSTVRDLPTYGHLLIQVS